MIIYRALLPGCRTEDMSGAADPFATLDMGY
jgi:hypothetical protein